MVVGVFQGQTIVYKPPQQQPYNPFSNIYNPDGEISQIWGMGQYNLHNHNNKDCLTSQDHTLRIIFNNSFSLLHWIKVGRTISKTLSRGTFQHLWGNNNKISTRNNRKQVLNQHLKT